MAGLQAPSLGLSGVNITEEGSFVILRPDGNSLATTEKFSLAMDLGKIY